MALLSDDGVIVVVIVVVVFVRSGSMWIGEIFLCTTIRGLVKIYGLYTSELWFGAKDDHFDEIFACAKM